MWERSRALSARFGQSHNTPPALARSTALSQCCVVHDDSTHPVRVCSTGSVLSEGRSPQTPPRDLIPKLRPRNSPAAHHTSRPNHWISKLSGCHALGKSDVFTIQRQDWYRVDWECFNANIFTPDILAYQSLLPSSTQLPPPWAPSTTTCSALHPRPDL